MRAAVNEVTDVDTVVAASQDRQVRLLAKPEVLDRLSISNDTLYSLIRAGRLPRPVKIGVASRWPEHEIDAFIAGRLAEREAADGSPLPNTGLHRYRQRQARARVAVAGGA